MRWAGCWGKRSRNRDSMGGAALAAARPQLVRLLSGFPGWQWLVGRALLF